MSTVIFLFIVGSMLAYLGWNILKNGKTEYISDPYFACAIAGVFSFTVFLVAFIKLDGIIS